jgi:hypothetical protein
MAAQCTSPLRFPKPIVTGYAVLAAGFAKTRLAASEGTANFGPSVMPGAAYGGSPGLQPMVQTLCCGLIYCDPKR